MSYRHLSRTLAMQSLYQWDFHGKRDHSLFDIMEYNFREFAPNTEEQDFARELLRGIEAHLSEIDVLIQKFAPEWPLDQITFIDRNILRLGLYELKYGRIVPAKVAIDEAIMMAKIFGGDASGRFVSGVLGSVLQEMIEQGELNTQDIAKSEQIKRD